MQCRTPQSTPRSQASTQLSDPANTPVLIGAHDDESLDNEAEGDTESEDDEDDDEDEEGEYDDDTEEEIEVVQQPQPPRTYGPPPPPPPQQQQQVNGKVPMPNGVNVNGTRH